MANNIYQRKDGRYEARIFLGKDENGKRRYHSFYGNTREEAEYKMLAATEAPDNLYDLTEMTIKELSLEYLRVIKPRLKSSTEANYRAKLENHIIPAFGDIKCCLLKVSDIYAFIESIVNEKINCVMTSKVV